MLPRQLALKVLKSLQTILFPPLSDPKSRRHLAALVTSLSLDPDVLRFERTAIRRPGEEGLSYVYFAGRLAELCGEVRSPRPRGWLGRRVERRSGARYMMLATLVGVRVRRDPGDGVARAQLLPGLDRVPGVAAPRAAADLTRGGWT